MALKIKFNSPVILTFSMICVAVMLFNTTSNNATLPLFTVGSYPINNPIGMFTLVSHALGHIDWVHLMGNLSFILLLGPIAEEKYGSSNLLIMMVITALVTGFLNIFLLSSGLLGASGIVFMLILLVSFTNVRNGEIPITFILVALLYIGKEMYQSLINDNVSQFAHIIGGVCGSIFGFRGAK